MASLLLQRSTHHVHRPLTTAALLSTTRNSQQHFHCRVQRHLPLGLVSRWSPSLRVIRSGSSSWPIHVMSELVGLRPFTSAVASWLAAPTKHQVSATIGHRSLATSGKGKKGGKKGAKASKIDHSHPKESEDESSDLQHEQWVKFQQTIKVDGFETGQQTVMDTRRGKKKRPTRKQQKFQDQQDQSSFLGGGGEYPALQYSQEETERLLAQAYAAIPERAGKRGTKRIKRQQRRWHLVRQVRKKYKYHMANFQKRKMEKRSQKIKQVKEILHAAPDVQARDRDYQARVLKQWHHNVVLQRQGVM